MEEKGVFLCLMFKTVDETVQYRRRSQAEAGAGISVFGSMAQPSSSLAVELSVVKSLSFSVLMLSSVKQRL